MATILTAAEFIAQLDEMVHEVCIEEGIEYDAFIADLAQALKLT